MSYGKHRISQECIDVFANALAVEDDRAGLVAVKEKSANHVLQRAKRYIITDHKFGPTFLLCKRTGLALKPYVHISLQPTATIPCPSNSTPTQYRKPPY